MIGIEGVAQAVSARDIAVTGLKAQRLRMNLIANNIANAETTRTPEGGPFRRQLAIFRAESLDPNGSARDYGVEVADVITDPAPFRTVYDPGHPDADEAGYVAYPNVNMAVEMVNLVSAQRAYEANVAVIVSEKRISQAALEIIRA